MDIAAVLVHHLDVRGSFHRDLPPMDIASQARLLSKVQLRSSRHAGSLSRMRDRASRKNREFELTRYQESLLAADEAKMIINGVMMRGKYKTKTVE